MEERKVDYGTTHEVSVISASKLLITVHAEKINEGFLLVGHGLTVLPAIEDKGKIVFERDQRKGHWQYYPAEKTTN